jgi:DNA-binding NarL/FixJ family response regulator
MKLLIADSNEIVRLGLKTLFERITNVTVVGESIDKVAVLRDIESLNPDVILIDFTAKNFNIDVIPSILQRKPNMLIVAITPEQSAHTLVNALRSGVKSYVKKDCDSEEIVDAVRETWRGKRFFCGTLLETIRNASINVDDIDIDNFTCDPVSLSARENEIITLVAEGLTNAQIAEFLCLSNHTVNTHRKNIMAKLGVKNTAGIVMYAVKANFVSPNKFIFSGDS